MKPITSGEATPPTLAKKLNRPPVSRSGWPGRCPTAGPRRWPTHPLSEEGDREEQDDQRRVVHVVVDDDDHRQDQPEMMGVLRARVVGKPRRSIQSDQLPAVTVPISATRYGIVPGCRP